MAKRTLCGNCAGTISESTETGTQSTSMPYKNLKNIIHNHLAGLIEEYLGIFWCLGLARVLKQRHRPPQIKHVSHAPSNQYVSPCI